jgi:hypothetical protein
MTEIDVDIVEDEETLRLWTAVGDLVGQLPGRWVLIGGLMVQLHAIEHGIATARATVDIVKRQATAVACRRANVPD